MSNRSVPLLPRLASFWLAAFVDSPALRDAMLGDLAEVAAAEGRRAAVREMATSTPALLLARLTASGDLALSLLLALLVASPVALADAAAGFCLSAVPFKATAVRPLWFAFAAAAVPALVASIVARTRSGAPVWWPLSVALASAVVAPAAWPATHQLAVVATLIVFSSVHRPRRIASL